MALRPTIAVILTIIAPKGAFGAYYGKLIGQIKTYEHDFSGTMYAAGDRSIVITNLKYDGRGPAAFFWASTSAAELKEDGDQLPDEGGSTQPVKAYKNAIVYLKLPRKITEYKAIGMYCKIAYADFGHVKVPSNFELPKEQSLGMLTAKRHNTMATEVILTDSATMLLRGFEYGASCPGSAFFVAGPSVDPKPEQLTHLLHDNGQDAKLQRYDKKDVTVKLPGGHHWNEFKWFSVYCSDARESYADVAIKQTVAEQLPLHDPTAAVPPPQHTPSSDNAAAFLGPFSAVSTFALSVAIIVGAVAVRQFFETDNRVKTC
ncbi:uncharacterized protein LOC142588766 [Dermacentor variabilis]|uniref:uncharacterized protein LOC142588766 n=1 Tax=Dermacentor variabilis TaxID=34621 RepID=UPI003F5C4BBD